MSRRQDPQHSLIHQNGGFAPKRPQQKEKYSEKTGYTDGGARSYLQTRPGFSRRRDVYTISHQV